jgi:hypothetical protein
LLDPACLIGYIPPDLSDFTEPENPRAQLERLQKELEARQSVSHFTHAGIAFLASMVLAASAVKLFWDSIRTPILGICALVISVFLAVYGTYRCVRGKRDYRRERERFELLQSLRRHLNIDDPSALLPR